MSIAPPSPPQEMVQRFVAGHQAGALTSPRTDLAEGLFLNADPALTLSGTYQSKAGQFLDIKASFEGAGGWFGLHITLDLPSIWTLNYIGFVTRMAADKPVMMRACLRCGTPEGGFQDSFFDKHLQVDLSAHTHLDALALDTLPALPVAAPWYEMIVFLPCQDFDMSIQQFHIFAV